IDSVPGGIGLTGWLNQTYSAFEKEIVGGADGMLDGFQSVLPNGGDIGISEEAATYRPEMAWIAGKLNQSAFAKATADTRRTWRVVSAENYDPQSGVAVYRFFELFDLPNIPGIERTLRANAEGKIDIT